MPDILRFFIFMLAAFLLFLAVLRFTTRHRHKKPTSVTIFAIGLIVVVAGMLFARYSHLYFAHLSWVVYYGIPALITVLLPPLWLRMSRREVGQYLPLAWLMAPVIQVFFSLFVGWHDFMPFPVYIPSLVEMIRHFKH